ncbi:MAG: hypothetical protein KatS3mg076_1455 [Candidatus Binatia bacterium]|nr:MAG: hypothetical protein KatS3mg076_1455 [Candidatus Binatia bacterium]
MREHPGNKRRASFVVSARSGDSEEKAAALPVLGVLFLLLLQPLAPGPARAQDCQLVEGRRLKVVDSENDLRDRVVWRAVESRGGILIDDPTQGTTVIELFDATGLVLRAQTDPTNAEGWYLNRRGTRWVYREKRDPAGGNGLARIASRTTSFYVRGKGPALDEVRAPLVLPATVRVTTSAGRCLESVFVGCKRNDDERVVCRESLLPATPTPTPSATPTATPTSTHTTRLPGLRPPHRPTRQRTPTRRPIPSHPHRASPPRPTYTHTPTPTHTPTLSPTPTHTHTPTPTVPPTHTPSPTPASTPSALPAFPGAEGFGATTVGGRGGVILKVTNLDADGPGSLRAALEAEGPRIVVFDVGGTIDLGGESIIVRNPFLTVAGQTAPGDGILVKNGEIDIRTHDVVIRGLRIRVGDIPNQSPSQILRGINITGNNAYNIVVDHNSISWGRGGNLYVLNGARDVTFSWNIVAEALRIEGSKGITHHSTAGGNISSHHNVLVSNNQRNPQIRSPQNVVANNLVYNYGQRAIELLLMPGDTADVRANVFLPGPSTATWPDSTYVKGIYVLYAEEPDTGEIGTVPNSIFLEANIGPGREVVQTTSLEEEWLAVDHDPEITQDVLVATPFHDGAGITMDPPETLQDLLLDAKGAGAIVPYRDPVDERVIASIQNGTGQILLSQDEVGGWPEMSGGTPPVDTDGDAMPDDWELARGLDPTDPEDRNGDLDGDGYTNVEEYLNEFFE